MIVEIPGVGNVEFPDGTAPEVIEQALSSYRTSANTNPGVNPEAPPEMFLNPQTGQYTSRELLTNHMVQNETAPTTAMGATFAGAGRGATLGGIDEVSGYLNAAVPGKGTMAERNTFGREMVRSAEDAAREVNPDDFLTGEIAGAISLPLGAPMQGMKLPGRIAGSAASGGTLAAIYGALTGEGQDQRLEQAKDGLTLGATVGAAIPVAGAVVQKGLDARAGRRAIREAVKSAPTTEALRAEGRAAYQSIDDAGVAVRPDAVQSRMSEIARLLADEGADPILTPNANRVATRMTEAVPDGMNTVPFSELDKMRRIAGNAAGANPANRPDTRLSTMALEGIDDFVQNLGPDQIDAGDIEALQTMLPKAREIWARMSRSQLMDDAIEAGSNNYRIGTTSGIRAQFQRILNNPKLKRGFSEPEIQMIRKVVNGTLPEQMLNYLGSGLGMMAQATVGGLLGGLPGVVAGGALGAGARKLSENVVSRNAEIARALVASGKVPQLPTANPAMRQIIETLTRRAGTTVPQ